MRETVKRRTPNGVQSKRPGKPERKDNKMLKENGAKALNAKGNKSKALKDRSEPEVSENVVIQYVGDVKRSEVISTHASMAQDVTKGDISDDHSSMGKVVDSDSETMKDSVSSQGDSITGEDDNLESTHRDQNIVSNNCSSDHMSNGSGADRENDSNPRSISSNGAPRSATSEGDTSKVGNQVSLDKDMLSAPEPFGFNNKNFEVAQEIDVLDQASNAAKNDGNDNEFLDAEEDIHHEDEAVLNEKIEEMEARIDRLEEELREVAALEVSLYSIAPEHGGSTHKVHTPARRMSRLYIHSCNHWTQNKRATIAKNTVTGLILVARSCGNDVPRLTFWLSNAIVLRNTISQALGSGHDPCVATETLDSDWIGTKSEENFSKLKWKSGASSKQVDAYMQLVHDWKETRTFTSALEKVESWIFSRIVESVWWKALAPHMQSPADGLATKKMNRKLLGPALGNQQQGSFSINLWRNAFQDAFQQLCPVRAGGHECGCLPVLATMVMEQCIARLDVAMFNAILRESASEMPTDPVSDPIVDSNVLPIPAGDLSFRSGAQLKNSIGNWSRWLTDTLGMDIDDSSKVDQHNREDDFRQNGDGRLRTFVLLNALSDLLMLPKDMLMDRSIRLEVCPSISISLIKRILCNFTPDEFCPDPVPGAVLEALNAESIIERRLSKDSATSFPYPASPVSYTPPDVKLADVEDLGGRPHLSRNSSGMLRKGYMSDEELEELNSPLASIIHESSSSSTMKVNGKLTNSNQYHTGDGATTARYELLHEVWAACLS